ncbi:hypothetical protein ACW7N6_38195 [Streptomyces sp. UC1A3]
MSHSADMIAEWDENARHYPFVTDGIASEVTAHAHITGAPLPDLDDKNAVREYVENARTA